MSEQWAKKDELFKAPVPKEKHFIDGFGHVWIHGLTCGEKDEYENDTVNVKAGSREVRINNARAVLIQRTVYDQHGNRLFAEKDIGKICRLPAAIAEPIYEKARRLSRMAISDIEDLVKNSETVQSED